MKALIHFFLLCEGLASWRGSRSCARARASLRSETLAFWLLLFIFQTTSLLAQTTFQQPVPMRFGGYAHGAWNVHTGVFSALPGVPACCPEYRIGTGFGASIGGIAEIALFPKTFLSVRPEAALHDARFQANEPALISLDGTRIDAVFKHTLQTQLRSAGASVMLGWKPFSLESDILPSLYNNGFSFYAGARGMYLWQSAYSQREQLSEPTGRARYLDGTTERNVFQGASLPNMQPFQASAVLGFGYDITINEAQTLLCTPEIFVEYGITPVVQGLNWRLGAVRGGISLRLVTPPPEEMFPPLPPADPSTLLSNASKQAARKGNSATDEAIRQTTSPKLAQMPKMLKTPLEILTNAPGDDLRLIINAVAVDSTGKEAALVRIVTEEFISTQMYPLLPYIFFDRFSAMIPARYQRLATRAQNGQGGQNAQNAFTEAALTNAETLEVYYHLLNIVGERMQKNPTATLRIVGCLGKVGLGPDSEENSPTIGLRRAEAVSEYLRYVWGIDAKRLKPEGRALPEKPSNALEVSLGEEDNRRVELYSDDWNILKPVQIADTLRISNPPDILFRMQAFWRGRPANVTEWAIDITQNGKFMNQLRDNTALPPEYRWNINARRQNAPRTNLPLQFSLAASDDVARDGEAETSIPVELKTVQEKRRKRIADKEIDEYRLINFEFEKAQISPELERILQENIRPNVKPESQVLVRGFTDKSGSDAVNERISQARAEAVSNAVGLGKRTVKGLGSSITKYPNTVPEGRFYSRTVEVRVETPVK